VKVWEAFVQSQIRFNRVPEKVWEALVQRQVRLFRRRFRRRFREALVQRQVRFNRIPKKVPEKAWETLVQAGQVQQGSREGSGEGSRKPWCKAKSGSTGSGEGSSVQKIKRCDCWGYHRSLFFFLQ